LSYLVNISNLLGLTLQNVKLFEQVTARAAAVGIHV